VYVQAPPDGIYDFDFVARPPTGMAIQVILPIFAGINVEHFPADLRGVRVHASNNAVEKLVTSPPTKPVITDLPLPGKSLEKELIDNKGGEKAVSDTPIKPIVPEIKGAASEIGGPTAKASFEKTHTKFENDKVTIKAEKEFAHDKPVLQDGKNIIKEFKEHVKEVKEHVKDSKDIKEVKEKDKDLIDGPGANPGGIVKVQKDKDKEKDVAEGPGGGIDTMTVLTHLANRLTEIEATLASGGPFIRREERPDVGGAAATGPAAEGEGGSEPRNAGGGAAGATADATKRDDGGPGRKDKDKR
jgi:hypothetical protein